MDNPYDHHEDMPAVPNETALRESLERSAADVVAGRTVPVTEVLADLDRSIARMEKRSARR